jgi:putative FmdB family regulatory protein
MPTYTYRCENCTVQFDQVQKFTDQPLTRCPECGKKTLHKVYSPVGIVFKGSGFYSTDHRSPSGMSRTPNEHSGEKSGESTSSEKDSAPKAESKSEAKTEAKSESKSESKVENKPASKES